MHIDQVQRILLRAGMHPMGKVIHGSYLGSEAQYVALSAMTPLVKLLECVRKIPGAKIVRSEVVDAGGSRAEVHFNVEAV